MISLRVPLLLFLSLILTACSGGSSTTLAGGTTATGSVAGRVVDTSGAPMAGALAKACDPSGASLGEVVTGSTGLFNLDVPAGLVDVAVKIGGDPVYQATVLVVEDQTLNLGDVTVDASLADWDGDGLPDALEEEGWTITLDLDGYDQLITKTVTSSPYAADTDGDGLDDATEFASRIDPTRADTDGDALSDLAEMTMYKSNPSDVDTDGDARGPLGTAQPNPSLFDGQELSLSGTSPTLADTDGDGLTDYEEILGGGFNPRIADLPQLALELNGDPSLTLNAEKTQTQESVSASSTLQRDQQSTTQTDSVSTKLAVESSQKISQEVSTKLFPPKASVKTSGELQFKESFSRETSSSWSQNSVQETQQTYSNSFETGEQLTFKDGEIQQALKFVNQSERTFLMKDMKVIAFRLDPLNPNSFQVVGTLSPTPGDLPIEGLVLAPGGEATFIAQNGSVNWQAMQPLMQNPSSLFFEVGSYSLFETDELGTATKNFAVTGQDVLERCGLIVIDFGDGRVERYSIATNVERNPDGSAKGVALGTALTEVVGLSFGTEPDAETGQQVLTSIDDRTAFIDADNDSILGFWTVAGNGSDFGPLSLTDFADIKLETGKRVTLMYLSDTDGDGLFDREEEAWGTSKDAVDTDLDGLGDGEEVHDGWDVIFLDSQGNELVQFTYHVYPDPSASDTDLDGLTDFDESLLATDPRNADTDDDGLNDSLDPSPLDPPGDTGNPGLGQLVYYPLEQNFVDTSGNNNDGIASSYSGGTWTGTDFNTFYDEVDRFSLANRAMFLKSNDTGTGDITTPWIETPVVALGTSYSYSIWVKTLANKPVSFLAGHAGGDRLSLDGGAGAFEPTYVLPLAAGGTATFKAGVSLTAGLWSNVVVVVSTDAFGSNVTLYVDGVLASSSAAPSLAADLGSSKILIGAEDTSGGANRFYMGSLDDIRVYQKAIDASTVASLFGEGGFGN